MTVRACFIGNSHLAAIKLGHATRGGGALAPTFFGAAGGNLRDVRIKRKFLLPRTDFVARSFEQTSGGSSRIDTTAYDLFVIVGTAFRIQAATGIYETHRLLPHCETHHPISEAALAATVRSTLERSAGWRLMGHIRTARPDARIAYIPDPLPSSRIRIEPSIRGNGRVEDGRALWSGPWIAQLHALYVQQAEQLAADAQVTLVWQPASTVEQPAFTDPVFSHGAPYQFEEDRVYGSGEHFHMNAAYGRLMLEAVEQAVGLQG